MMLDYNNRETESPKDAVAKKDGRNYYIKRSSYGFFYNENKLKHRQAMNTADKNCYVFTRVSKDIYDMYVSFLRTGNEGRANIAERMWNVEKSEKLA